MEILLLLLSLSSISTVVFSQYECVCGLISHIWAQKRDLENLLAGGGSPTLCATGISSLSLLVCVCPGILNIKVLQPCGSHEGFF